MTKNDIRELVETVLARLSTDETPQTACRRRDICADDPCCFDFPGCTIWDAIGCTFDNPCADDPCAGGDPI